MKTIVFAATKGGVGKSTLCFNVAIEASRKHQVLLADLDPQKSLTTIYGRRNELVNPRLVTRINDLGEGVKLLTEAGYGREFIFVDTPGSMIPIIRSALVAADLIVLPLQPSPLDWDAQEAVADLVESLGLKDRMMVVINRSEGKSDLAKQAAEHFALRTRFPILEVKHRVDYARGAGIGQAGFEVNKNKDAAKECRDLWKAMQDAIDTISKSPTPVLTEPTTTKEDSTDDRRQLH